MTKRLFYLSLSLLCLVAAYQLGADRAMAEWDNGAPGQLLGGAFADGGPWVAFTAEGEAWSVTPAVGWTRYQDLDLPVSATEVKFLDSNGDIFVLITTDDVAWEYVTGMGWFELGAFPGGPVPLKTDSWGKAKDRYRD
jgi:hypothetical protein